ncbi:MAG TPA: hypothetical protein VM051_11855 [Usitatibacter sp.]|nr:hypothetical protein [Usitatibacter sp.]
MNIRTAGLVLVLSSASIAHAIDDAAFQRCRGIRDASARLACYDGLPMDIPPSAPQAPPIVPSRPQAAAPQPAQPFGMESRAPAVELPATMESTIAGRFEGWGPNARIKLANGTVWQVVDGTSAYLNLDNPKVVVRRGMMGGFFLEVENSNRSPRVRRLQ